MKTEHGVICNMTMVYGNKNVDPGRRVRFCRHMRDMECKELSTKVGISPSYMGAIERNRTKAPMATYEKIAAALGMSVDEMFGIKPINWNK